MSREGWTQVDDYIASLLVPADDELDAALEASHAAGLAPHQVSTTQGKLLYLLAKVRGARRILEIGTLGGYSAIWLARALLPGGRLVTLEADPKCAAVARANFVRAGLDDVIEVRVGRALDTLPQLAAERPEPFDLVFIDADKPSNDRYLAWALRLSVPGTLIIGDNVVRDGAVADAASNDANVQGVRRFFSAIAADKRLSATAIQTVGSKGYDGFAIALVIAESVRDAKTP